MNRFAHDSSDKQPGFYCDRCGAACEWKLRHIRTETLCVSCFDLQRMRDADAPITTIEEDIKREAYAFVECRSSNDHSSGL